ncbi:MAG: aspartate/glutamate racemase family protein [Campylobacteraceae bacterium]
MKKIIGILGGMGPAATVDMFDKFVKLTDAKKDQDHIPLLISSIPDVPDRTEAMLHGGKDPLKKLVKYMKMLEDGGAKCIVIPCNTAHYWFDKLKKRCNVHMISIVDSTLDAIKMTDAKKIGILATDATLSGGLYQKRLEKDGFKVILPKNQKDVMDGIYIFKAGDLDKATKLVEKEVKTMFENGADLIICGCTEIPIILKNSIDKNPEKFMDATIELVRASIKWYKSKK